MSKKLSIDLSELKTGLIRKLKGDTTKDKIKNCDTNKKDKDMSKAPDAKMPDAEIELINSMAASLGLDTNLKDEKLPELNKKKSGQKTLNSGSNSATKTPKVKEDFLPIFMEGLSPHMQEKAKKELGETEEKIQHGLKKLKANREDGMPILEDNLLLAFLRVAKYDLKKAQERLSRYYKLRRTLAKSIDNLQLEKVRKIMQSKSIGILPYRDSEGRGIATTRGYNWWPEICDFEDWVLTAVIICVQFLSIPANSVCGMVYLIDMQARDYTQNYLYFKHIKSNLTLAFALPARPHIECLHENYICHWFFKIVSPHLPKKLMKRLRLHGYDYDSLHKHIDPCILPEEYGGTLGPINYDYLMESFEDFFIKFKEENRLFLKK